MSSRVKQVQKHGQSIWQDYIQRSELFNGTLENLIEADGIHGITSNPTIFHKAITSSQDYDQQFQSLVSANKNTTEIYHNLTVDDIKDACKIMGKVYKETGGKDGFVSLEVNPHLAYDTQGTITEALALFAEVNQPNLMIKVPGTPQGVPAIRTLISEGVNVNVTLLFSPKHYENAALAYIEGLEERARQGKDLTIVNSVASFFLSRIDTQVDIQLDALFETGKIDKEKLDKLRGQAAIAVSKVTYQCFEELFFSYRFDSLIEKGAKLQRPLWASTGTKDPAYSDVKYVDALIGPHTVNTLPPATINAFRDHGIVNFSLKNDFEQAPQILKDIESSGIDLNEIYSDLQSAGVKSFEKSYEDLLTAIEEKAANLRNA